MKPERKLKLRSRDKEALLKVKELLDADLTSPLCINELCKKSGLNADKLKRGFKLLYGHGPFGYRLHLKIEKAKEMLVQTDDSISEIAFTLGYEHSSSFCAAFKEMVGVTAGEWRSSFLLLILMAF